MATMDALVIEMANLDNRDKEITGDAENTKIDIVNQLAALRSAGEGLSSQVHQRVPLLETEVVNIRARLNQQEARGSSPSASAASGKGWQLTRPRDMGPAVFTVKDEEWLRWKGSMEDFMDQVHPGLKQVLNIVAKTRSQVTDRTQLSVTEEKWNLGNDIFVLLKRKTIG